MNLDRLRALVPVDLTDVSYGTDKVRSTLSLRHHGRDYPWLLFGAVDINPLRGGEEHIVSTKFAESTTDFEHDSASVFRFTAIGLRWTGWVARGTLIFSGHIHPTELRDIHVPTAPLSDWHKALPYCEDDHCVGDEKHRVVPENYYAGPPPSDDNAWLLGAAFEVRCDLA